MTVTLSPPEHLRAICPAMPRESHALRAMPTVDSTGQKIGVDRQRAIIFGVVVAQIGEFKTEGRGQFDSASLSAIARLMQAEPEGLRSHFTHGGSGPYGGDRLPAYLGRMRNARVDRDRVRADLHLTSAAFKSPLGNLAEYVLTLVEADPGAVSTSLVLSADQVPALTRGAPNIWRPTRLVASDLVSVGEAVDAILGTDADADDARLRLEIELLLIDAELEGIDTTPAPNLAAMTADQQRDWLANEIERIESEAEYAQ
jgi:hypothetical protein